MIAARPLTLGEIFDRGITLFVRNAPVVLALAALYYVPHAIFDGYSSAKDTIVTLVTVATHPHAAASAPTDAAKPIFDVAAAVRLADLLFVWPLINAVLAAALGFASRGAVPPFAEALRIGIARWGASLVVWLAFLGGLLVALVPLAVVVVLPGVVVAGIGQAVGLSGVGFALVVGVVDTPFALAALAALLFLATVCGIAGTAVVVDRAPGLRALATAWRRCLRMPGRAVVVSGAQFAIGSVVGISANMVGDAVIALTHLVPLAIAVNAAAEIAVLGVLWGISIVYYEDQRVRSEGDDLAASITPMGAPAGTLIA